MGKERGGEWGKGGGKEERGEGGIGERELNKERRKEDRS